MAKAFKQKRGKGRPKSTVKYRSPHKVKGFDLAGYDKKKKQLIFKKKE